MDTNTPVSGVHTFDIWNGLLLDDRSISPDTGDSAPDYLYHKCHVFTDRGASMFYRDSLLSDLSQCRGVW